MMELDTSLLNTIILASGLLPMVTWAITYTWSSLNRHLKWSDGISLSQSMAAAPERFAGSWGLSISMICVVIVGYLRKVYCDITLGPDYARQNRTFFIFLIIGVCGCLMVCAAQCGDYEKNEIAGQCVLHLIAADTAFFFFLFCKCVC